MSIQPTKSLEHSLYAAAIVGYALLAVLYGYRDANLLLMFFVVVIFEVFRRWRGPQTIQEESLTATDFRALNISKK